jgi:hypothetical protein
MLKYTIRIKLLVFYGVLTLLGVTVSGKINTFWSMIV